MRPGRHRRWRGHGQRHGHHYRPRHGHHHEPREIGPLRRYVRARLHRRIFVWFGLSIILTIAVVSGVVSLGSRDSSWRQDAERAERFVARRFAEVWSDPGARARLLAEVARDFEAGISSYDASGAALESFGGGCADPVYRMDVTADGARDDRPVGRRIGRIDVCRRYHGPRAWVFFLTLAVAGVCLWLASGVIARRIIRPLGRVVGVARDIGDGKLASRVTLDCRHSRDELGVLARAINDMAERIQKQMDDQRELLAAVSHELRTPLGHMRVLLELLGDRHGDDVRLAELEREILEVDSLVGQLLASSRLAFDTLDRRSLDAADVAARALDRAGLDAATLRCEARDTRFDGDPTLLARALANLLDNARNHGGGVASLRVFEDEADAIGFEVTDSGPGFADDELEHVFGTFYRGEQRAGQSSLGLGLALVRRIARAHDGRAWARNRAEGGACVGFTVAASTPPPSPPPASRSRA